MIDKQPIINDLKQKIEKDGYVDISKGTEKHYCVSKDIFRKTIVMLEEEGYIVTYLSFGGDPKVVRKILSKEHLTKEQKLDIVSKK